MGEILVSLGKFNYEAPSSACAKCRRDYKRAAANVRNTVQQYFDGLCLDFLDRSKPKTGHLDIGYWSHQDLEEYKWVLGCRFCHRRPTCFFTNGREEEQDRIVHTRPKKHHQYNSSILMSQQDHREIGRSVSQSVT
ncbi:MAG: hypothetical protein LQ352_006552, partial [Teloschistes flavicans]